MKKFFALLLAMVMVLPLTACNTQPKMGAGNTVIATSGDEKILLRDFLYTLGSYKAQNEYYIGQMAEYTAEDFKEYWLSDSYMSEGKTMFDDLKDSSMESVKEMATLYKIAKDNGFRHNDADMKEMKASMDSMILSLNSQEKTGERFFYEYYFVTPDEAYEYSKIISAVEQYENSVMDSIEVTDDDAKAFYDDEANKSRIDNIQKATVAHILVQIPEGTEEAGKADYKAKAEDLLARAEAGENFGQLAAEYSEDPGSKDNNGEYTITRQEQFVQEFLDWTFAAAVGDFGIVETSYGYHVMHLVSLEGYEEMKEGIKDLIKNEKYSVALDEILAENQLEWVVDQDVLNNVKYSVYGEEEAPVESEEPENTEPASTETPK